MLKRADQVVTELEEAMPDAFGAQLLRAQLTRSQGRHEQAAEALTDLYLQSPSSTLALQMAGLHASEGRWTEAEGWYDDALHLQPASPEAMLGLVLSAHEQGNTEWAREQAIRFLQVYPDHAELVLVTAELHLMDGRPEDGYRDARMALQRMPRSPWAYSVTAQALWELGRPDPSIEHLQEALNLERYNLPLRARLTDCLLEVGRSV